MEASTPSEAERMQLAEQKRRAAEQAAARAARGGRGRRVAVVSLVVLGCVLTPIAGVSVWLNNQVTKPDRYERTIKPLASNPDIQAAISNDVTGALFSRVDVAAKAQQALPPRAQFLAGPLANGLETYAQKLTQRFLASPRFQKLWLRINLKTHDRLVRVLTGKDVARGAIETKSGKVVLDLGPILGEVRRQLDKRGVTVFDNVPDSAVGSSFVLIDSKGLTKAQRAVRLLNTLAWVLPLLALICLAAAVALSTRRRRTLLQASLGVAAALAVLGILLAIGRSVYLDQVAGPALPHDAAAAFFDIVVHWLRFGLRALLGLALLVAAGAFVTGPSHAAVAIRRHWAGAVALVRRDTVPDTGSFGHWVGRNKKLLRVLAIFVPVVILALWGAPTPALVITLVVIALVALAAIELVGWESEETPPPPTPASPV
jgi:hypothetical protein